MNNIKLPDLSTADWSILSDYKKEIPQTECQRGIDGGVVVHNEPRVNRKTEDIQLLLEAIPANCSYNEWFRVAAALKNERYSYELFRAWSASSEEKYDEQSCERLWESVGNCEKNIITTGTLKYLAKMHGFNNLQTSCNEIPSELPLPENKEEMILQTTQFIATLFGDNDHFQLVTKTGTNDKGKAFPLRLKENLMKVPGSLEEWRILEEKLSALIDSSTQGAWITFNPARKELAKSAVGEEDITQCNYILVEADEISKEQQWKKLHTLDLPVETIVWSGGKSYHALVKIDAGNDPELFKKRVKLLYKYLDQKGFPADAANKNASRLTRVPGFMRNGEMQYIAAWESGPLSWQEFEEKHIQGKVSLDRRSITSVINGQQGGRPSMPVTDYAVSFLERNSENNIPQLRYWDSKWWQYTNGLWQNLTTEELYIRLTRFLQQQKVHFEGRISTSLISDIIANLKGLCGLTGINMPCWLPRGEDASDIICFHNGLLSIRKQIAQEKQKLCPHTPEYFGTDQVEYVYQKDALCPLWQEYLNTTFDTEESREALQMMFGYVISGKFDKNIGFFLIGRGGDGKSVAAHILRKLVGEAQTCCLPFANLGDRFSSYLLTEHKLNLVEELPVSTEIRNIADAEKVFKMVTDGAVIPIEQKFHAPKEKQARARCVFLANELPAFVDRSNGLWDRLIVLPFNHRFRDTDSEKANLKYDLESELPGIFNWAVEGAKKLEKLKRFPVPPASAEYLAKHRLACDHEAAFLHETVVASPEDFIRKQELYQSYRMWVEAHGYKPFGMDRFNAAVKAMFPDVKEMRHRTPRDIIVWSGISYNHT